jgi:beta-glucosidase
VGEASAGTGKPVLVTENGIGTEDDARRVAFIGEALTSLHSAIAVGANVLGYIHWSALDNFEWALGYGPKFGLIAVDRETFQRHPKPSAEFYAAICRRNGLP